MQGRKQEEKEDYKMWRLRSQREKDRSGIHSREKPDSYKCGPWERDAGTTQQIKGEDRDWASG